MLSAEHLIYLQLCADINAEHPPYLQLCAVMYAEHTRITQPPAANMSGLRRDQKIMPGWYEYPAMIEQVSRRDGIL
ncbi:MAG: hypothetical protein FWH27_03660 [Planctomycetaceae bacterium]|nr:hypothetical protein [Planctomycetaceae bacterium]